MILVNFMKFGEIHKFQLNFAIFTKIALFAQKRAPRDFLSVQAQTYRGQKPQAAPALTQEILIPWGGMPAPPHSNNITEEK